MQRKSWKNCNNIIKAYNLTNLQMLTPLQSHDEYLYNWHLHFAVARFILGWSFWHILFLWCVGTQNARWWSTEYHIIYRNFSTWLKIWCLVHPDCKEDDGSFVLHRCNQLWETCQQIIASRPATFASLHPYNGPNRKGSNLWHIMVKPCLSRVTCPYFLTLLVVMLISGRAHR